MKRSARARVLVSHPTGETKPCSSRDITLVVGITLTAAFAFLTAIGVFAPAKSPVEPLLVKKSPVADRRLAHDLVVPRDDSGQPRLGSLRLKIAAGANGLDLLKKISETQPAQAIDLALALGREGDERDQWVTQLTRSWAAREPQAAWNWLGQQTARMEQLANGSLIGVVLDSMAEREPQRVVENIDTLLHQGDLPGTIPPLVACQLGLTALLAHGDLDLARGAVEDWAQNPRTLEVGASAYTIVAGAIGQSSWADAGAWLASLPVSADRTAAFAVLASKWGDHDPVAALDWAESLGTANGQFTAIQSVFSDWAERDGIRAGEWLSAYVDRAQSEDEIDRLIGSVITFSTNLKRDPEQALSWVALMREPARRDTLTERVVLRWGQRDPLVAFSYVARAANLTATQRQMLTQKLLTREADPEPVDE